MISVCYYMVYDEAVWDKRTKGQQGKREVEGAYGVIVKCDLWIVQCINGGRTEIYLVLRYKT